MARSARKEGVKAASRKRVATKRATKRATKKVGVQKAGAVKLNGTAKLKNVIKGWKGKGVYT